MIYKFNTQKEIRLSEVGGKAKALIETKKAGFNVPDGIVLSVGFFKDWTRDIKKSSAFSAFIDSPSVKTCDDLKKIAQSFLLTQAQNSAISKALGDINANALFAVRSSSPEEDLEGTSFAGGYETTLGVKKETLQQAIKDCFISMLDFRIVEYKRQHKMAVDSPSIAVIIQKQIASDVSGVGFSQNPQGEIDEVMINANFGLGETVVSGMVTPDIYVVKDGKVANKKIANKHVVIHLKDGGGTLKRDSTVANKETLSKRQAQNIAKLAKDVEAFYEKPMDIEWAIARGALYLLQSRPITSDGMEIRWAVKDLPKKTILARGSIAEMMPDPLLPLYADYVEKHVPATLHDMMDLLAPSLGVMLDGMYFPTLNGYGYYQFTITAKFFGVMIKNAGKMIKVFKEKPTWIENEKFPEIKSKLESFKQQSLKTMDTIALYEMTHELTNMICRYYTYCQIYFAQAYKSEGLFIRFYDKKIKPKVNIPSHVLMLGGDSAPILADKALYRLCVAINEDESAKAYYTSHISDQIRQRLQIEKDASMPFYSELVAYFKEHANMVYDLDFSKQTPQDDFRPILEALKAYIEGAVISPIERQEKSLKDRALAEKKIKATVSKGQYKKFKKKMDQARELAPYRENGMANMGLCQPFLREVFANIGERLVKNTVLSDKNDIYWLKDSELVAFAKNGTLEISIDDISKRKALWNKQKTVVAPSLLPKNARVLGINISAFIPKELDDHDGGNVYEGNGVSSGKVTGKARVILSPEEFHTMQKGEILVTAMTTPAWTPLFALASGVVADFGGPLSHSSIVAREYGIPAVLGTGGTSKIIVTGQTITVDADNNKVMIEAE
jgi:rifampicin phosphotransferase